MHPTSTLLALALVGLPVAAQAQALATLPSALNSTQPDAALVAAPANAPARPLGLNAAVGLTRRGTHRSVESTLVRGLEIVDRQMVDVDGDGDQDALLHVDLRADEEPKPELGRGVVVAFRERRGWRGQTVGSVGVYPMESGYNWGRVETLRAGAAPLVHVMYSDSVAGHERQMDTVLHFGPTGLRPVFTAHVESVPGSGEGAVTRSLDVQTADVDGDGTNEILERVAASQGCPETGCFTPDGMFAPVITRRAYRFDAARGEFIEDGSIRNYRTHALRLLDDAMARWRAGDLAARDAGILRAYAQDPLDARVRMAYARTMMRTGQHAQALSVLEFAWPQGFGRDARLLQAESAAYARDTQCHTYLASVRNSDPDRGDELTARLSALSPTCRMPGAR